MADDLNSTVLVGRLTRDPELRSLPSGMCVADLRLAFSTYAKGADGGREDKSNFVGVTVWGKQGEAAARNLAKGRRIGVRGRLEHREYQAKDGSKREVVSIVADYVQYLDPKDDDRASGGGQRSPTNRPAPATPAAPADDSDVPF